MKKRLFILFQYCVPQHTLSRIAGWFASTKIGFIKSVFIRWFAKKYWVSLDEAARQSLSDYESFNDFFTRELRPGARQIDLSPNNIISPADGAISQAGKINVSRIFQAKGRVYSLEELLARKDLVDTYKNGHFATIYLSPKDYHRVHMPISGKLTSTSYVPGDLFSVNPTTVENVPELFARNERLVCHFDTELGSMCVILVGAMIVAGIETTWSGHVAPAKTRHIVHTSSEDEVYLEKGAELGRFKLGSTVILLFQENKIDWNSNLKADAPVKMGRTIASIVK